MSQVITINEFNKLCKRPGVSIAGIVGKGNHIYSEIQRGKREDLDNVFYRSKWEANYARFLNFLLKYGQIESWEFESDEWKFPIERGIRFYLCDFTITEKNGKKKYIEVKGYMDRVSKVKLKRMKRYYPHIDVEVVDRERYRQIESDVAGLIPKWEY